MSENMSKPDEQKVQAAYQASTAHAEKILEDPDKVAEVLKKLEQKLNGIPDLGDKLSYLPKMGLMINSYIRREYLNVSTKAVIAALGAVLYFVNPIDVIPDFIPVIGLLDDVAVVSTALLISKDDIDEYMEWRKLSGRDPEN